MTTNPSEGLRAERKQTKKAKIVQLFESAEWIEESHRRYKILDSDDFYGAGLAGTVEYGEYYGDVIYAQRIFRKMGYQCHYGSVFFIVDNFNQSINQP